MYSAGPPGAVLAGAWDEEVGRMGRSAPTMSSCINCIARRAMSAAYSAAVCTGIG